MNGHDIKRAARARKDSCSTLLLFFFFLDQAAKAQAVCCKTDDVKCKKCCLLLTTFLNGNIKIAASIDRGSGRGGWPIEQTRRRSLDRVEVVSMKNGSAIAMADKYRAHMHAGRRYIPSSQSHYDYAHRHTLLPMKYHCRRRERIHWKLFLYVCQHLQIEYNKNWWQEKKMVRVWLRCRVCWTYRVSFIKLTWNANALLSKDLTELHMRAPIHWHRHGHKWSQ